MLDGLPERWQGYFPATPEEAKKWQRYTRFRALASRVLVVATTRIEGAWCVYCDAVPGYDHRTEAEGVLDRGNKLSERVALVLFPEFEGVPYAD